MDFLEKVNLLMQENRLNKHTLSEACGIPYTTIDGWFKKGYEGAKVSTLIKLADYFAVELDYLVRPSITDRNYGKQTKPSSQEELFIASADEAELNRLYRSVKEEGRSHILYTARLVASDPAMKRSD